MRMIFSALAIAGAIGTTAMLAPTANAERVCKQECSAGVCKEQCVESTERDRIVIEGRGERREEKREERHEDRPGIEFKAPGVGVEIGR
jgi:hypothetical protein